MLLGKFMPPHRGHVYLVEFAQQFVDELFVVVGTLESEPIPGELRYRWMSELFPAASVIHLTDDNPQEPREHPAFWEIWQASLERVLPVSPDFVFASEPYGAKLAEILGAQFVPVDPGRLAMPISGTAVRDDPLKHWDYLPRCVRPHYLRRVCLFGPESTGKSTLARQLAEHYQTVFVPEYARTLLEAVGRDPRSEDMPLIARGQLAAEDALARDANRLLICDTDVATTAIWSEVLFGECDPRVRAAIRDYDLYLLTDVDVPWVEDPVRYLPEERRAFFERCRADLERRGQRYAILSGTWDERFEAACRAIDRA